MPTWLRTLMSVAHLPATTTISFWLFFVENIPTQLNIVKLIWIVLLDFGRPMGPWPWPCWQTKTHPYKIMSLPQSNTVYRVYCCVLPSRHIHWWCYQLAADDYSLGRSTYNSLTTAFSLSMLLRHYSIQNRILYTSSLAGLNIIGLMTSCFTRCIHVTILL